MAMNGAVVGHHGRKMLAFGLPKSWVQGAAECRTKESARRTMQEHSTTIFFHRARLIARNTRRSPTMSFVSVSMNPAAQANSMRREIERLLQDIAPVRNTSGWVPAANGYENATGFVMEFEVPGFTTEQLDVTAQDGALIVSGNRPTPEASEGTRALFIERPTTNFERRLRLPKSADVTNISATYANGVLTVRVAKLAVLAPRKVAISIGEAVENSAESK
jgi:HSP20 family protein